VVFHDSTLAEIARQAPRSLEELASIAGVGPAKLDRYGAEVLATLVAVSANPAARPFSADGRTGKARTS
jgi:superfamily II DNA helicase RecQ